MPHGLVNIALAVGLSTFRLAMGRLGIHPSLSLGWHLAWVLFTSIMVSLA